MLKAAHGLRHVLSLALLGLISTLLVACGGGGSSGGGDDSAFVPEPLVVLSGTQATLVAGDSTEIGVILDRPAPRSMDVNIFSSADPQRFHIPGSVRVAAGRTSAKFTIRSLTAGEGATAEVSLVAGSGYNLGAPTTATITVSAAPSELQPEATLAGGNTILAPGAQTTYAVVLAQRALFDTTVNLIAVGDAGQFTIPATVTIPAGGSAATFTVAAGNSALLGSSIELSIVAGGGYSVGTPQSATVTIGEGRVPTARLNGGDSTLAPGASTQYVVVLDQPAPGPFTVNLATSGDAGGFSVPATISFQAGESAKSFNVSALPEAQPESAIEFSIVAGTGYTVGAPSSASVSVGAGVLPEVTLGGQPANLAPGEATTYTLVLDQPSAGGLTVNLSVSGNTDAFSVPASVGIAPGASSASFTVSAQGSAPTGAAIQLSVVAGAGYTVGAPSTTTVTVGAGLLPQVQLAGGNTSLTPGASTVYGLILNQPAVEPVTVSLSVVGAAGQFDVPDPVTIPAGASSASFTVAALGAAPAGASIQMSVVAGAGYTVGAPSSATVSVVAATEAVPQVTLAGGNTSLTPGGNTVYGLILNQPAPADITVGVSVVGDAGQFDVPVPVTISAGASSASFTVSALGGAPTGASIQMLVVAGTGYTVGTPSSATVSVVAATEAVPQVTLAGGNTSLAPGASTVYALILNQPAPADITVGVSVVGDAGQFDVPVPVTILAGASSASFTVSALGGAPTGASIEMLVVAGTGYTVGTPSSATVSVVTSTVAVPQVTLAGGNTSLTPGSSKVYALLLNQPAPADITVGVSVVGDAGQFDVPVPVTILAGASSANFTVSALGGAPTGASIQMLVVAGAGYTVGTPSTATVSVAADALPQVTLAGGDTTLSPNSSTLYAVVLDRTTSVPVTVNLSVVGDASQFFVDPTVTIPANASSASFTVSAFGTAPEGAAIQLSIVPGSGYVIGAPSSANINVSVADLPEVRLLGGDAELAPGGATTYAAVLDGPAPAGGLALNLILIGDAGSFVVNANNPVVIPAGDFAATFQVDAQPGATIGDAADLVLAGGVDYQPGDPSSANLVVTDVSLPVVSLLGANVVLREAEPDGTNGGTAYLAVALSEAVANNVQVAFVLTGDAEAFEVNGQSVSGTLTIPAGDLAAPILVQAIGPRGNTATLTLVGGAGYVVDAGAKDADLEISVDPLTLPEVRFDPQDGLALPNIGSEESFAVEVVQGGPPVPPGGLDINYVVVRSYASFELREAISAAVISNLQGVFPLPGPGLVDRSATYIAERVLAEGYAEIFLIGGDGYRVAEDGAVLQLGEEDGG